jgi:hypothetical protein
MAALVTLALLGACGGGGGAGGADVAAPAATAPVITAQPSDTQVVAGGDARFQASAQGTAVSWSWQRSNDNGLTWSTVANAGTGSPDNSTSFLTVTAVSASDNNARFRAVATSSGLQALSSAATLTVSPQVVTPTISVQVLAQQVVAGGTVTFAITAMGTDLQYQWQNSRDGAAWTDVAGATSPTLVLPAVNAEANGTLYRVAVRNSAGSVTSNPVTLTVTPPVSAPTITLQPAATAVTAPNTATFTVAATGQPTPTLQWQRSTNAGVSFADLPGATGPSYTTAATTLQDNGAQFRAVATSSAGTATSLAATLTVGAGLSLPVFTTQPQDVNVTVGQTATWTAAVSGVPTPTFQWQLSTDGGINFANINGATSSSYSLVPVAGDSGKRYRVVASNSEGATTSRTAVLTVPGPASVFAGRGWLAGARLNRTSDFLLDQTGAAPQSIIDRAGRVHVLYMSVSSGGPWEVLVSTSVPGASGVQPTSSAPLVLASGPEVLINARRSAPFLIDGVWLAPSGNATALWTEFFPCPADAQEACSHAWSAAYDSVAGSWGLPSRVTAREVALLKGKFNDVGDQVAWVPRVGDTSTLPVIDLGWRQRGRSDIETVALGTGSFFQNLAAPGTYISLDNNGAVVLVGLKVGADGAINLIARRGSIRTGTLGADEELESRSAPATLNGFWSNTAGQVVLLWYQDNGTRVTQYASTLNSSDGSWTTTDLGARSTTDVYAFGTVTGSGDFYAYSPGTCRTLRRVSGAWISPTALPSALCATSNSWAMDVNGNLLAVNRTDGRWASFAASSQSFVQPFVNATPTTGAGFVLGTRWNSLPGSLLLSDNGIGAFVTVNSFDALPTASAPNGDSRGTTVKNVWSIYFK